MENWGTGIGHATPAFHKEDKAPEKDATYPKFVQTGAQVNTQVASERKAKMVTNTAGQVAAELAQDEKKELVTPHQSADNGKDSEPK